MAAQFVSHVRTTTTTACELLLPQKQASQQTEETNHSEIAKST
jgi:hypothetical protein